MLAIGVKNVRSLSDTGKIRLSPITVLVGSNSAGKSTFLRLIPLLKQSVEVVTRGPVLWYGRYVDFGSYDEARNSVTKEDIEFKMTIPYRPTYADGRVRAIFNVNIEVCLASSGTDRSSYVKHLKVGFFDHIAEIDCQEDRNVTKFLINGTDILQMLHNRHNSPVPFRLLGGLIPKLREVGVLLSGSPESRRVSLRIYRAELRKHTDSGISTHNFSQISNSFYLGSSDDMLTRLKNSNPGLKRWTNRIADWTKETPEFIDLRDLYVARVLSSVLDACDEYFTYTMQSSRYIEPIRAAAERYYRFQDLAVDEVDPRGSNLAFVLKNLSKTQLDSLSNWTEENFDFGVYVEDNGSHYSIKITDPITGIATSLADIGFGFSQLLPILVQLWMLIDSSGRRNPRERRSMLIFAVEQPELHLHPKMQAQFADAIAKITKSARESRIELSIIIETHSETIVNRLGNRIYKNDLDHRDVSVMIFDKDQNGISKITESSFDSEGYLKNWPVGFFSPEQI